MNRQGGYFLRNIAAAAVLTVSLSLAVFAGQAKSAETENSLFATPLKEIEEAAEQLQELSASLIVERRDLDAAIAEFAPILAKLCRVEDARRLETLGVDDYKIVVRYVKAVATVMDVFSDQPEHLITRNTNRLSSCFDVVIIANTVTLNMAKEIAQNQSVKDNPEGGAKTVAALNRTATYSVVVFDGVLDGFLLREIAPEWCVEKPVLLLPFAKILSAFLKSKQKQYLAENVQRAAKACPASRPGLYPVFQQFR